MWCNRPLDNVGRPNRESPVDDNPNSLWRLCLAHRYAAQISVLDHLQPSRLERRRERLANKIACRAVLIEKHDFPFSAGPLRAANTRFERLFHVVRNSNGGIDIYFDGHFITRLHDEQLVSRAAGSLPFPTRRCAAPPLR